MVEDLKDLDSAHIRVVKINWDAHRRSYVISLSHAGRPHGAVMEFPFQEQGLGIGNQVEACIKLVLETLFCGAVAKCNIGGSHSGESEHYDFNT
eukprot:1836409-Rhodomonas_salina.2